MLQDMTLILTAGTLAMTQQNAVTLGAMAHMLQVLLRQLGSAVCLGSHQAPRSCV